MSTMYSRILGQVKNVYHLSLKSSHLSVACYILWLFAGGITTTQKGENILSIEV